MFVLRKIDTKGVEINFSLEDNYQVVQESLAKEEFERLTKVAVYNDDTYGFVVSAGGKDILALQRDAKYFIMTGEGSTFARINELPCPSDRDIFAPMVDVEATLVKFGNYLFKRHEVYTKEGVLGIREVTHADIENWKTESGIVDV